MMRVKERMGQYFQLKAAAQEAKIKAMEESKADDDQVVTNDDGNRDEA